MSALNPQINPTVDWISPAGLAESARQGCGPNPLLQGWLTDPGLLTARIRKLCGKRFQLEVLGETTAPDGTMLRRVLLRCEHSPCIYAETVLPAAALEAYPWLRELGDVPLGEALQNRADIDRGEFEFAQVKPAQYSVQFPRQLAKQFSAASTESLWARRSPFSIGSSVLTVTEFFLPGVISCEQHRMHTAEQ